MKVQIESLDSVRKKIEVILPDEQITGLEEQIYGELKKQANIRGFRPGKVPRSIITNYYKDYIDDEVKKRMVQSTMAEALSEVSVDPVTEPVIDFIHEEGRRGYTLEVEVLPEIDLPAYKGIEVEVEPISVTDEEVARRIESLREMHAEMVSKPIDHGAEKGDFVIIKYQAYENGKPLKDVATEGYPLELGSATLMPEFESGLFGMKAGEEKEIEVNFPADYPDKDIASKKLVFRVQVKEIKEKRLPEVNDEFAKDLNFETMGLLEEGARKEIEKEKEMARRQDIAQKVMDVLIGAVDIPIPKRLLEKRVEMMMQDARSRFKMDRFSEEELKSLEDNFRKDFEQKAEERTKGEIVLSRVAVAEGIKVEPGEIEERLKKIAEDTKKPYNDVKTFYENYDLMENMKTNIVREKALNFLSENAITKEKA
jgi:trigger factor